MVLKEVVGACLKVGEGFEQEEGVDESFPVGEVEVYGYYQVEEEGVCY